MSALDLILNQTPAVIALLFVWLGAMIAVPILRWTFGEGAEHVGISIGVLAQVALVAVLLFVAFPLGQAIAMTVAIPVLGWASEVLGSRSGVPFGRYHYTEVLRPQIAHVPVLIPLAWLMMIPPAFAVGVAIAPANCAGALLIGAAAFMAWDLFLDPQMVRWRFWEWEDHGPYLGIPLVNFFGWFVVALVIGVIGTAAFGAAGLQSLPVAPLVAVYVITWALELVGQAVFWDLRFSALVGGVGMGVFVVAAIVAIW
jgi:lycopene beta-cyclase